MKYLFLIYLILTNHIAINMDLTPSQLEEKLYEACEGAYKAKRLDIVKECLEKKANINMRSVYEDETPLLVACRWENAQLVTFLLQQPTIDANASSTKLFKGYTALHHVISSNDFTPEQRAELFHLLIQKGANIRASADGVSLLELAIDKATYRDAWVIEELINQNISMRKRNGFPLLTTVVLNKKKFLVPLLLKSSRISKTDLKETIQAGLIEYQLKLYNLIERMHRYVQRHSKLANFESTLTQIKGRLYPQPDPSKVTFEQLNSIHTLLQKTIADMKNQVTEYAHTCNYTRPRPKPLTPKEDRKHTKFKNALDEIATIQSINSDLCAYYKSMRLMEHIQPLGSDWQTSKVLELPVALMKMIAQQTIVSSE